MVSVLKEIKPFAYGFIVTICAAVLIICLIGVVSLVNSPVEYPETDSLAPELAIIGDSHITIRAGDVYEDPGATVYDADNPTAIIPILASGEVDTNTPGDYIISYSATDDADNTTLASRVVTVLPRSTGVIYLTFDDGPSPYTAELLDVLAKYNVKATFFVTAAGSDEMLVREYNEGHAIGLHSCTHNYAQIYTSVDNFFADLYCVQNRVKNATGYTPYLMRFPGGSSNLVSASYDGGTHIMSTLTREVEARGFTYFDWNVTSGDAGGTTTADGVYYNVINRVYSDGKSVVLQHDIKAFSVAAVERIVQWGLANGFTFDKLTADSFTAHHGVNN